MSRIKVKHYRIPIPRTKSRPKTPIRIAVIGDLHNRIFGEGNSKLVEVIQKQYPDLVISVGDLTVCHPRKETKLDVPLSLLKRLSCDCPVYCVNGNHECRAKVYPQTYPDVYARLSVELRNAGITLLENSSALLEMHGAELMLYGLEIPMKYYERWRRDAISAEEIRGLLGDPDEDRYNILMAHNPVFFESYVGWGADLSLSGHLHGGMVRLPFAGGVISPQMKLFPRYDYGMFEKFRRRMVVTSGLGTHSFAFRVNNPPEIAMIELA